MKHYAVLLVLFLAFACKRQPAHIPPAISFYYWKTTFALAKQEREALQHYNVKRLYVRYCDVVLKQGEAVPESPIVFRERLPNDVLVVPVIFIRNQVMLDKNLDPEALAQKIVRYIADINAGQALTTSEVQIDCDWSLKSRDTYFKFLTQLRRLCGIISVTVRLHQVKYFAKTGVPPADRRVLMYYNMGHIGPEAASSVYDRTTAESYLAEAPAYPQQLNVALPIFSWGIHLRDNRVIGLLNKADDAAFDHDPHFARKTAPFFEVTENVLKLGKYFKRGDRVKIESITAGDLREMAEDLAGKLPQAPAEIVFYDLDAFNLNHFHDEEDILEDVRRAL